MDSLDEDVNMAEAGAPAPPAAVSQLTVDQIGGVDTAVADHRGPAAPQDGKVPSQPSAAPAAQQLTSADAVAASAPATSIPHVPAAKGSKSQALFAGVAKEPEKQKWVQCAACNKWRRVPYTVSDEQLSDDWQCKDNIWDAGRAACDVPQVLSNEEIDSILALQGGDDAAAGHVAAQHNHQSDAEADDERDAADYDVHADHDDAAAARGGRSAARGRGRGRRITGLAALSPINTADLAPAAGDPAAAAAAGAVAEVEGTPGSRGKSRAPRAGIRWGNRRNGSSRGSRGGSLTPRDADGTAAVVIAPAAEDLDHLPAGVAAGGVAVIGSAVEQLPQPAGAAGPAADLGEAAEALLGMGMDLDADYHRAAAAAVAASAAARQDVVALAPLQYQQPHQQQQHLSVQHGYDLLQQQQQQHLWHQQQQQHILTYPRSALRPGKVVWAKVEGHDWWPACVVRRRAVPKEVGPPPGGQAAVLDFIPVVFFTAKGIPGEVEERLDTPAGLLAASMRAAGLGDDKGEEEAEYAWLPYIHIKPFNLGDVSGNDSGIAPADPVLLASVAAAEAMLRTAQQQLAQPQQHSRGPDDGSDSEGGWGVSREQQPPPPPPGPRNVRGRARNNRARGKRINRGRSNRAIRGRRGITPEDDVNSDSEGWVGDGMNGTTAAATVGGSKNAVEAILAWRAPRTQQDLEQEQVLKLQQERERVRKWEIVKVALQTGASPIAAVQAATAQQQQHQQPEGTAPVDAEMKDVGVKRDLSPAAASPAAMQPAEADEPAAAAAVEGKQPPPAAIAAADVQMTDAAPPRSSPDALHQPQQQPATAAGLGQEEADAAAALLGFGSDDHAAAVAAVLDAAAAAAEVVGHDQQMLGTAAAAAAAGDGPAPFQQQQEPEYFVKWSGKSHIHNEWLPESQLLGIARRKLLNFKKRHGGSPVSFMEDDWLQPERFLARRPSPSNPGWEVLVKWKGQAYDACTWESEQCPALMQPEHVQLHLQLWDVQKKAITRASDEARQREKLLQQAAERSLPLVDSQPSWVCGTTLHHHQLQALQWLRSMWARKKAAVLADEQGMGKTASAVGYVRSLLREFEVTTPVLVVVPWNMLGFWEGELAFWASPETHVVSYSGSVAARNILQDNELWLQPSSLDGKAGSSGNSNTFGRAALTHRVAKPQVVLTTHEVLCSDFHVLSEVEWSSIILDQRQRSRVAAGKAQIALQELVGGHKVVLSSHGLRAGSEQLFTLLTYIRPGNYEDIAEVVPAGTTEPEQQAAHLASILEPHVLQRCLQDIRCSSTWQQQPPVAEVQVTAEFSAVQAEAYKLILARNYEILADPKPPRSAGTRGAQLRVICNDLKSVCQHTFMIPDFEPERAADSADAAASTSTAADPPAAAAALGGTVASDAEYLSALVAGSGKLQLLDLMLQQYKAQGKQVLVLAHSSKALELLADYAKLKFGAGSYKFTDLSTPAAERHAAVQQFNDVAASSSSSAGVNKDPTTASLPAAEDSAEQQRQQPFLFIMAVASIGLGTVLPGLSAVMVYESDWHPRLDIQALHRAAAVGGAGQVIPVFRIVLRHSVDERLLQLADRRKLDAVLRPGPVRPTSAGARTLEDVIRWGSSQLFANSTDTQGQAPPAAAATDAAAGAAEPMDPQAGTDGQQEPPPVAAANGGDVVMQDAAAEPAAAAGAAAVAPDQKDKSCPISFSRDQVLRLLDCGAAACAAAAKGIAAEATSPPDDAITAAAAAAGSSDLAAAPAAVPPADLGLAPEAARVKLWPDVEKNVEDEIVDNDEDADADTAEDDEHATGLEPQGSLAPQNPTNTADPATLNRSDSSAAASAYWSSLLKPSWESLRQDDSGFGAYDIGEGLAGAEGGSDGLAPGESLGRSHLNRRTKSEGFRDGGLAHEGLTEGDEGAGWGEGLEGDSDEEYADHDAAAGQYQHAAAVGTNGELLHHYSSTISGSLAQMGSAGLYGDQAGVDLEAGYRGSRVQRPSMTNRAGSTYRSNRAAPTTARGANVKGQRRRRTDDDTFYTPPGMTVQAELIRMGSAGINANGTAAALAAANAAAADPDRPNKRRRKGGPGYVSPPGPQQQQQQHHGGIFGGDHGLSGAGPDAARAVRLQAQVIREFARMEQVKAACGDAASVEHAIATRAFHRIEAIVQELGVDGEIVPMACQAAEILMMMRQEDEVPSDFQDYSLVTLVGVAAHLMHQPLGEGAGLELLAVKYGHDVKALDQVFWHILTKLAYYRELTLRIDQLVAKGMLDPAALAAAAAAAAGPDTEDHLPSDAKAAAAAHPSDTAAAAGQQQHPHLQQPMNEVDSFGAKLSSILAADLTTAALSQGSLDTIPLGPLATLMPLLQMAGQLNDPSIKSALKQVRESQESMVLLDRTHTLKVQQIQKEYQDFMERIRNKAQGAIDSANRDYQSRKALFSARINVMVEYLNQALQTVAQQIQRAAAVAGAPAAAADGAAAAAAVAAAAAAASGAPVEILQAAAAAAAGVAAQQQQQRGMDLSGPVAAAAAGGGGSSSELVKQEAVAVGAGGAALAPQLTPQHEQQVTAELLQLLATGRLQVDSLPDHLKAPLIALLHKNAAEHQAAAAAAAAAAASQPAAAAAIGAPQITSGPPALSGQVSSANAAAAAAAVSSGVAASAGPSAAALPPAVTAGQGLTVTPPAAAAVRPQLAALQAAQQLGTTAAAQPQSVTAQVQPTPPAVAPAAAAANALAKAAAAAAAAAPIAPTTATLAAPASAAPALGLLVNPAAATTAAAAAAKQPLLVSNLAAAAAGQPAGTVITSGAGVGAAALPGLQQHLPVITSVNATGLPIAASTGAAGTVASAATAPAPLPAFPVSLQPQQPGPSVPGAVIGRQSTAQEQLAAATAAAGFRPGMPAWQAAQLHQLVHPMQLQLQQQQQQHVPIVLPGHVTAAVPAALAAAAAAAGPVVQSAQQQLTPGVPTSVALAATTHKQVLAGVAVSPGPSRTVATGVTTAIQAPAATASPVTTGGPGTTAAPAAAATTGPDAAVAPAAAGVPVSAAASFKAELQDADQPHAAAVPGAQQQQHQQSESHPAAGVVALSMPPPPAQTAAPAADAAGVNIALFQRQQQQHGAAALLAAAAAAGPGRIGSLQSWLAQTAQAEAAAAAAAAALDGSPRAAGAAAAGASSAEQVRHRSKSVSPAPAAAAAARGASPATGRGISPHAPQE